MPAMVVRTFVYKGEPSLPTVTPPLVYLFGLFFALFFVAVIVRLCDFGRKMPARRNILDNVY